MCHCCGEKGYHVLDCPMKDKMSQEKWAIKKRMQMVQNPNNEATAKTNKKLSSNKTMTTVQNSKWKEVTRNECIGAEHNCESTKHAQMYKCIKRLNM